MGDCEVIELGLKCSKTPEVHSGENDARHELARNAAAS